MMVRTCDASLTVNRLLLDARIPGEISQRLYLSKSCRVAKRGVGLGLRAQGDRPELTVERGSFVRLVSHRQPTV